MKIPIGMETAKPQARMTQSERRDRTRRALLDAAAQVFARRGYHGAGVEEIAAQAGVTKGALYYNFAGKEDVFLALLDEHLDARLELLADVAGAGPHALREAARRMAQSLRRDREWGLLFFEFAAQAARDAKVRRRFEARMRRFRQGLTAAVAELAPIGADHDRLASATEALMNGYAMEALLRPGTDVGDRIADALDLLWRDG